MPFPLLSLGPYQLRRRATQGDGFAARDPAEDLLARRPLDLALQDLLDVRGQCQVPRFRSSHELVVESIGHVPNLDHLRHVGHMLAHAFDMSTCDMAVFARLSVPGIREELEPAT